jgi:hypothetical protein
MSENKTEFHTRDRWLMFAFALGPLAALSHLLIAYALVPSSCANDSKAMLHVSAASFFLLTLLAALIGWRYHDAFPDAEGVLWKERTRWFAMVVMVLGIAAAVMIVAMEIPNLILRSCD